MGRVGFIVLQNLHVHNNNEVLSRNIADQSLSEKLLLFAQDMHSIDPNYVKLFQLAQLTIEYLLVSLIFDALYDLCFS